MTNATTMLTFTPYRNCRRKREDDPGYDLDYHFAFRYPRYLSGRNDCQRGSTFVVSTQDRALQECQCSKLPS